MTRNCCSERRIHYEPPYFTQGAGDRPGGISPPESPLAKFAHQPAKSAQQELPYPHAGLPGAQVGRAAAHMLSSNRGLETLDLRNNRMGKQVSLLLCMNVAVTIENFPIT